MKRDFYKLGGFVYPVVAELENGVWLGKWFCPLCGESGETGKGCSSEDDAVFSAREGASEHYNRLHAVK